MEKYREVVLTTARSLDLLKEDGGELLPMDSLMIVDLIAALEDQMQIRIPAAELHPRVFASVDGVAGMLSRVLASK